MLLSLIRMRVGARQLAWGTLLLLTGCAGEDLLLPGDGVPSQLRAVSGDGQTAVAGTPVRNPLVVEALDASGVPVPGALIVFQFVDPPRGADIAPPAPETDATGRAAVEVTLGTVAGDQPVEARLADPDRDLSVRFLLTAIQPVDGGGGGGGDDDPPPGDGPDDGGDGGGNDDGNDGGSDEGGGGGGGEDDDDGRGGRDDDDSGGDDEKDDEGGEGKGEDGGEGKDEDKDKDEGKDDKDKDEGKDEDNSGKGSDDDRDDDRGDGGDDDGRDDDRDDDDHGDDDDDDDRGDD
ncbi:MAG TPA: hypothetical protein VHG35_15840 [Gemmatimonadales bacterium]|nr:hypothetical protein [Gemmatimonadales bacterium]